MPPKKKTKVVQKCIRKTALKPRGRSAARFVVKSIQTNVPDVIVSYCYRASDDHIAAFMKPLIDAFSFDIDNNGSIPELWNVQIISNRRAGEMNVPMKANPTSDSNYPWEVFVTINSDDDVTAIDIAENLATRFSDFKADNYESVAFRAEGATQTETNKPLNDYLLDYDVIVLLRMIYSTATKEELMEDEEIMKNFFGSAENGRSVLSGVSAFKWDGIF